jgi:hypothetical protein
MSAIAQRNECGITRKPSRPSGGRATLACLAKVLLALCLAFCMLFPRGAVKNALALVSADHAASAASAEQVAEADGSGWLAGGEGLAGGDAADDAGGDDVALAATDASGGAGSGASGSGASSGAASGADASGSGASSGSSTSGASGTSGSSSSGADGATDQDAYKVDFYLFYENPSDKANPISVDQPNANPRIIDAAGSLQLYAQVETAEGDIDWADNLSVSTAWSIEETLDEDGNPTDTKLAEIDRGEGVLRALGQGNGNVKVRCTAMSPYSGYAEAWVSIQGNSGVPYVTDIQICNDTGEVIADDDSTRFDSASFGLEQHFYAQVTYVDPLTGESYVKSTLAGDTVAGLKWTVSGDSGVCYVNEDTGVVVPQKTGTVTLRASIAGGGQLGDTIEDKATLLLGGDEIDEQRDYNPVDYITVVVKYAAEDKSEYISRDQYDEARTWYYSISDLEGLGTTTNHYTLVKKNGSWDRMDAYGIYLSQLLDDQNLEGDDIDGFYFGAADAANTGYVSYEWVFNQNRYYFPNMSIGTGDLDARQVAPMLATKTLQITNGDGLDDIDVSQLSDQTRVRLCMGAESATTNNAQKSLYNVNKITIILKGAPPAHWDNPQNGSATVPGGQSGDDGKKDDSGDKGDGGDKKDDSGDKGDGDDSGKDDGKDDSGDDSGKDDGSDKKDDSGKDDSGDNTDKKDDSSKDDSGDKSDDSDDSEKKDDSDKTDDTDKKDDPDKTDDSDKKDDSNKDDSGTEPDKKDDSSKDDSNNDSDKKEESKQDDSEQEDPKQDDAKDENSDKNDSESKSTDDSEKNNEPDSNPTPDPASRDDATPQKAADATDASNSSNNTQAGEESRQTQQSNEQKTTAQTPATTSTDTDVQQQAKKSWQIYEMMRTDDPNVDALEVDNPLIPWAIAALVGTAAAAVAVTAISYRRQLDKVSSSSEQDDEDKADE